MLLSGASAAAAPSAKPNVLLIILDDASVRNMCRPMRRLRGTDATASGTFTLSGAGNFGLTARSDFTWLTKCFSEVSQCDPSRYTIYTGVRASSHGVTDNSQDGSFVPATGMLQTVFKTAGYRIGHLGKIDHQNISAPSFSTDFYVLPANNAVATYWGGSADSPHGDFFGGDLPAFNYQTWENGVLKNYANGNVQATEYNYFGDMLGMGLPSFVRLEDGTQVASSTYASMGGVVPSKFQEWLANCAAHPTTPWFCTLAFENPHNPNNIAPRFSSGHTDNTGGQWWAGNTNLLATTPAHFAKQSNAPAWITALPTLGTTGTRQDERGTERCMLAMDDQITLCVNAALAANPNTLVVVTSDQGIAFGEHMIEAFKCDPYDPASNMLCGFRPPGGGTVAFTSSATGSGPWVDGKLMSNLDFASTICAVAGVPTPRGGPGIDIRTQTRASLPIFWLGGGGNPVPAFSGVRTLTGKYLRYTDTSTPDGLAGFEELFDLGGTVGAADPYEMANQAAAGGGYATLKASLAGITTP